ncbi:hypothetical protein GEMRC1_004498 [Eukaryota sp. GEM-RC1]
MEFHFPISPQYRKYFDTSSKGKCLNIRVDYPDGAAPIASKMYFFYSNRLHEEPSLPPLPPVSPSLTPSIPVYFETITVSLTGSIHWLARSANVSISLGDPIQRVLQLLGEPDASFPRQTITKIRRTSRKKEGYAFNYFERGLDVLVDGDLHEVDKIRLYCNFPGHPLFNVYQRAKWAIMTDKPEQSFNQSEVSFGSRSPTPPLDDDLTDQIHTFSTLDDVCRVLGTPPEPLVHNPASASNPFGPSHFYLYDSIVFEVIRNNHINSITLHRDGRTE